MFPRCSAANFACLWEPDQYVAIAFSMCGFMRGGASARGTTAWTTSTSAPMSFTAASMSCRARRIADSATSLPALRRLLGPCRFTRAVRIGPIGWQRPSCSRSSHFTVRVCSLRSTGCGQAGPRPVRGREPARAGDRVLWLHYASRLAHAVERKRPFAASLRAGAQKLLGLARASRPAARQPHEAILSAR